MRPRPRHVPRSSNFLGSGQDLPFLHVKSENGAKKSGLSKNWIPFTCLQILANRDFPPLKRLGPFAKRIVALCRGRRTSKQKLSRTPHNRGVGHNCLVWFFALLDIRWRQESPGAIHGPSSTTEIYLLHWPLPRRRCGKALCRGSRNRIIFSGAELQADFKPGGLPPHGWAREPDGKPMTYVRGKVLRF